MNMAVIEPKTVHKDGTDYRDIVKAQGFAMAAVHEKQAIIFPAVLEAFENAARTISREPKVILDYGCGPGYISIGLLNAKTPKLFAYDSSAEMIKVAKHNAEGMPNEADSIFSSNYADVKSAILQNNGADFGILSFVHPCMDTKQDLNNMFKKVSNLMAPRGTVIVIGANPGGLNKKHVTCEYDVTDPESLQEGTSYTGRIFDGRGNSTFAVKDKYWSLSSITNSAARAGLILTNGVTSIRDQSSMFSNRQPDQSGIDPFVMLTYKKRAPEVA